MKLKVLVEVNGKIYESDTQEVTADEFEKLKVFMEGQYKLDHISIEAQGAKIFFPAEVIRRAIIHLVVLES